MKLFKCFTLDVMNLKYITISLFEISYKKNVFPKFIFLDVSVLTGLLNA